MVINPTPAPKCGNIVVDGGSCSGLAVVLLHKATKHNKDFCDQLQSKKVKFGFHP